MSWALWQKSLWPLHPPEAYQSAILHCVPTPKSPLINLILVIFFSSFYACKRGLTELNWGGWWTHFKVDANLQFAGFCMFWHFSVWFIKYWSIIDPTMSFFLPFSEIFDSFLPKIQGLGDMGPPAYCHIFDGFPLVQSNTTCFLDFIPLFISNNPIL